jgi:hypothetical protein
LKALEQNAPLFMVELSTLDRFEFNKLAPVRDASNRHLKNFNSRLRNYFMCISAGLNCSLVKSLLQVRNWILITYFMFKRGLRVYP